MFKTNILPRERRFEHQIFEGTYHTKGLRHKDFIVFILQRKILSENCQKWALCPDRRPLRRDTIASRDRSRPMGARQNLSLYYLTFIRRRRSENCGIVEGIIPQYSLSLNETKKSL